jgi:hypothetical protein
VKKNIFTQILEKQKGKGFVLQNATNKAEKKHPQHFP